MEANDFIYQYYLSIKDKYPNLTYEQVEEMCRHPFAFVKEKMKQSNFPQIRLQYFGVFKLKPRRAVQKLTETEKLFSLGKITKEKFEYYTTHLRNFIQKYGGKDYS